MLLINTTHSKITINHGGQRVSLPPAVLVTPNAEQEKAVRDAMKNNAFLIALIDEGKINVQGKGMDREQPLQAATNPEPPQDLKPETVKGGKESKLKKLQRDGEMAV